MPAIRAIYENGVFRPLGQITLPDGALVDLIFVQELNNQYSADNQLSHGADNAGPLVGEELQALLDQITALPYTPHADGRTDVSAQHDDFLYPKQGKQP